MRRGQGGFWGLTFCGGSEFCFFKNLIMILRESGEYIKGKLFLNKQFIEKLKFYFRMIELMMMKIKTFDSPLDSLEFFLEIILFREQGI